MAKSAKSKQKTKKPSHVSPLTALHEGEAKGAGKKKTHTRSGNSKRAQKRARKEAEEDLEEERLTALLFGAGTAALGDSVPSEPAKKVHYEEDVNLESAGKSVDSEEDVAFEIDRVGRDSDEDEKEGANPPSDDDDVKFVQEDSDEDGASTEDEDDEEDEESGGPAWEDPDDATTKLVDASSRLKKLRKSRQETEALSSHELEQRLRQRYEETAQLAARTDWATPSNSKLGESIEKGGEDDEEENNDSLRLFSTSTSLLASSRNRLPPNVLNIIRCPDANLSDPNKAVVRAVNFHPGSDPDQPLVLTAGLDKTLRFFQVGEEKSEKIHGIHFSKMPIYSASFLGNTGKVVLSGRRSFFYFYDAVAGKVDYVPRILGRDERSWEKHAVSPDGQLVAFVGNDGYVVLVDSHSKQWVGNLKLNGSVRAITFTPDGSQILASGSDGDVYRWDVKSRRCLERFPNGDGTISSCLAASFENLAVGAESGVVNLYSERQRRIQPSLLGGDRTKTPLKSVMNLHTSADSIRFNSDGQILAMSTQREKDGLKLLHVPTQTVFSNWPTSKTPLGYVWSADFSPQSKYLAIGNDKGKCLLYKLNHYNNE